MDEALPKMIRAADYPQLWSLLWQRGPDTELTHLEALNVYERNWRHVDRDAIDDREWALINALAREAGGGRLLV